MELFGNGNSVILVNGLTSEVEEVIYLFKTDLAILETLSMELFGVGLVRISSGLKRTKYSAIVGSMHQD